MHSGRLHHLSYKIFTHSIYPLQGILGSATLLLFLKSFEANHTIYTRVHPHKYPALQASQGIQTTVTSSKKTKMASSKVALKPNLDSYHTLTIQPHYYDAKYREQASIPSTIRALEVKFESTYNTQYSPISAMLFTDHPLMSWNNTPTIVLQSTIQEPIIETIEETAISRTAESAVTTESMLTQETLETTAVQTTTPSESIQLVVPNTVTQPTANGNGKVPPSDILPETQVEYHHHNMLENVTASVVQESIIDEMSFPITTLDEIPKPTPPQPSIEGAPVAVEATPAEERAIKGETLSINGRETALLFEHQVNAEPCKCNTVGDAHYRQDIESLEVFNLKASGDRAFSEGDLTWQDLATNFWAKLLKELPDWLQTITLRDVEIPFIYFLEIIKKANTLAIENIELTFPPELGGTTVPAEILNERLAQSQIKEIRVVGRLQQLRGHTSFESTLCSLTTLETIRIESDAKGRHVKSSKPFTEHTTAQVEFHLDSLEQLITEAQRYSHGEGNGQLPPNLRLCLGDQTVMTENTLSLSGQHLTDEMLLQFIRHTTSQVEFHADSLEQLIAEIQGYFHGEGNGQLPPNLSLCLGDQTVMTGNTLSLSGQHLTDEMLLQLSGITSEFLSPMPGILKEKKLEGQPPTKIIECMKMESRLTLPADCQIFWIKDVEKTVEPDETLYKAHKAHKIDTFDIRNIHLTHTESEEKFKTLFHFTHLERVILSTTNLEHGTLEVLDLLLLPTFKGTLEIHGTGTEDLLPLLRHMSENRQWSREQVTLDIRPIHLADEPTIGIQSQFEDFNFLT